MIFTSLGAPLPLVWDQWSRNAKQIVWCRRWCGGELRGSDPVNSVRERPSREPQLARVPPHLLRTERQIRVQLIPGHCKLKFSSDINFSADPRSDGIKKRSSNWQSVFVRTTLGTRVSSKLASSEIAFPVCGTPVPTLNDLVLCFLQLDVIHTVKHAQVPQAHAQQDNIFAAQPNSNKISTLRLDQNSANLYNKAGTVEGRECFSSSSMSTNSDRVACDLLCLKWFTPV